MENRTEYEKRAMRRRRTTRVRFSHNVEVRPRDHARIDVIGEKLQMTNVDVVHELLEAYIHDRPGIQLDIAAKLPPLRRVDDDGPALRLRGDS